MVPASAPTLEPGCEARNVMDFEMYPRYLEGHSGYVFTVLLMVSGWTQIVRGGFMFAFADPTSGLAGSFAALGTGIAAVLAAIGVVIDRLQNPRIGRLEDRLDQLNRDRELAEHESHERHERERREREPRDCEEGGWVVGAGGRAEWGH